MFKVQRAKIGTSEKLPVGKVKVELEYFDQAHLAYNGQIGKTEIKYLDQ